MSNMHHVRVYRRRENGDLELVAEFRSIGKREVSFLSGELASLSEFVAEIDGEMVPAVNFTYKAVRSVLSLLTSK